MSQVLRLKSSSFVEQNEAQISFEVGRLDDRTIWTLYTQPFTSGNSLSSLYTVTQVFGTVVETWSGDETLRDAFLTDLRKNMANAFAHHMTIVNRRGFEMYNEHLTKYPKL